MKNLTPSHNPARIQATSLPPIRRIRPIRPIVLPLLALLTLLTLAALPTLHGQTPATPADPSALPATPSAFQPVIDGLAGKYGWLTTVLLAIGSLRILFKPVMLVVENAAKNDPAKLAAIQQFEAGPIYRTIATVLDVGASIKLPLVKPPGPGPNNQ